MSIPMCQGFSNFSGFLHNIVILAKLATSNIRVKAVIDTYRANCTSFTFNICMLGAIAQLLLVLCKKAILNVKFLLIE